MTTASKITMVRVVLIPFFIVFLILSGNGGVNADTYRWVALGIFVVASLSDFLDGTTIRSRTLASSLIHWPTSFS